MIWCTLKNRKIQASMQVSISKYGFITALFPPKRKPQKEGGAVLGGRELSNRGRFRRFGRFETEGEQNVFWDG